MKINIFRISLSSKFWPQQTIEFLKQICHKKDIPVQKQKVNITIEFFVFELNKVSNFN